MSSTRPNELSYGEPKSNPDGAGLWRVRSLQDGTHHIAHVDKEGYIRVPTRPYGGDGVGLSGSWETEERWTDWQFIDDGKTIGDSPVDGKPAMPPPAPPQPRAIL